MVKGMCAVPVRLQIRTPWQFEPFMNWPFDVVLRHQEIKLPVQVQVFEHGPPGKSFPRQAELVGHIGKAELAVVSPEHPIMCVPLAVPQVAGCQEEGNRSSDVGEQQILIAVVVDIADREAHPETKFRSYGYWLKCPILHVAEDLNRTGILRHHQVLPPIGVQINKHRQEGILLARSAG